MLIRNQFRTIRWIDMVIGLVCLSLACLLIWKYQQSEQVRTKLSQLEIELAVPNLDPDVAAQIRVKDIIVDQAGEQQFEIIEKVEKASEQPIITMTGELLVAKHPKLTSVIIKIRSLQPMSFQNGIQYNWQVIKIGGNLIWETKFCRFVGLVRKIE